MTNVVCIYIAVVLLLLIIRVHHTVTLRLAVRDYIIVISWTLFLIHLVFLGIHRLWRSQEPIPRARLVRKDSV